MTRTASALATIDGDKANSKMSHNEAMQRSYEGRGPPQQRARRFPTDHFWS